MLNLTLCCIGRTAGIPRLRTCQDRNQLSPPFLAFSLYLLLRIPFPPIPPRSKLLPLKFEKRLLRDAQAVGRIEVVSILIVPFEDHQMLIVQDEVRSFIERERTVKASSSS